MITREEFEALFTDEVFGAIEDRGGIIGSGSFNDDVVRKALGALIYPLMEALVYDAAHEDECGICGYNADDERHKQSPHCWISRAEARERGILD